MDLENQFGALVEDDAADEVQTEVDEDEKVEVLLAHHPCEVRVYSQQQGIPVRQAAEEMAEAFVMRGDTEELQRKCVPKKALDTATGHHGRSGGGGVVKRRRGVKGELKKVDIERKKVDIELKKVDIELKKADIDRKKVDILKLAAHRNLHNAARRSRSHHRRS